MIHHYLTKYKENGRQYAEAWLQLNIFGGCFRFSKKRVELRPGAGEYDGEIRIKTRIDNSELDETMKKLEEASELADGLARKRTVKV